MRTGRARVGASFMHGRCAGFAPCEGGLPQLAEPDPAMPVRDVDHSACFAVNHSPYGLLCRPPSDVSTSLWRWRGSLNFGCGLPKSGRRAEECSLGCSPRKSTTWKVRWTASVRHVIPHNTPRRTASEKRCCFPWALRLAVPSGRDAAAEIVCLARHVVQAAKLAGARA